MVTCKDIKSVAYIDKIIAYVQDLLNTRFKRYGRLNTAVYRVLTDNAAMSDGIALFHEDHGNLASSGGAIAVSTLSAGRLAMRTQTRLKLMIRLISNQIF
jgi:hypothetical protein